MPLVALKCKWRKKTVTPDECLACSVDNEQYGCPFFPEYIRYVRDRAVGDDGRGISVTRLLGCPRKAYLMAAEPYIVTVEDSWFLFRGTVTHSVVESLTDSSCIKEVRFSRNIDGVTVTGQPDKIDHMRGIIYDYKTVKVTTQDYSLKWGNPRTKDVAQLSWYKKLIEPFINITRACLVYVGSDTCKKFWVPILDFDSNDDMKNSRRNLSILSKVWGKPLSDVIAENILPQANVGWECKYCPLEVKCKQLGREE